MASLFKRKASKNWQIRYYRNGKENFKSTRTSIRREAEKRMARLDAEIDSGTYQNPGKARYI